MRDRGCAWPGCDRPPEWTDAHHIVHWANGGRTSLDNLALLCRTHHTKLHEHHWTARLTDEGELEVKPP
ncbi:MAG: HNH endonuclease [Acidimicrobiia bacterium]|nr:HNH endonuclease [Acidimicrobiia bacterium]